MDCDTQTCADGGHDSARAVEFPSIDPLQFAMLQLPDAVALLKAHHDCGGALTDLEWQSANPAAERLLGVAPLAGRRLRGSGSDAACPGLFSALADALRGPVERTVAARRGTTPVRWRVAAGPVPGGLCAILTDLGPETPTVAEALAESLTAALEHSAESFALFDHADRLVHANGRLKKDLPALADRLVPGVSFEELAHGFASSDPRLTSDEDRTAWMTARLERHRRLEPPAVVPLPDGRWLLSREHAVPGGVLVHYTDVTTLKLNEERLRVRETEARAARAEAENASRAKSAFLAQMSHELRTPLNAVLGFSEMLLTEPFGPLGNPRYHSYAADIRDAGTHLLAMIDDILELSRLDSGSMPLAEEGVDLDTLSLRVVTALAEVAEEGGVRVRREVPAGLPMLQGDAQSLTQMLTNLLSNAVTHTRPGGEVVLTVHLMPDGGLGLMVADTGVGIPTADLPRILHPFDPSDSTIARNSRGTGFGLPIVKRLVEIHGGRLELTSQPGVGTAVVLVFPAERSLPRDRCRPAPLPPIILPP